MHYHDLSTQVTQFQPSADKPDRLLTELHEAQLALAIAEHHITLWRAKFATMSKVQCRPRISCVAHQALHEAGRTIDHIAELLKIQAHGTRATQQGNSVPIYTEASPADARGEPARQSSPEFA